MKNKTLKNHHSGEPTTANSRRNFLRTAGQLSVGLGLAGTASSPVQAGLSKTGEEQYFPNRQGDPFVISILQTTDVHCQLHPHDELFWENDKAVFRKTGGYAHLATYLKKAKKQNPHTFILDTGDMFQGSELSVKTTGKALTPILNHLPYDLYLPGNWEVVYNKQNMQTLMGGLLAPKVCANMYHDVGNGKRGELIFPPYHIWSVMGLKIGFIGYTDPMVPLRQSPNYSKGIIYSKPEENIAYYIDLLRNQEQCAYVIVIAHLGLSQQIHLANLPESKGLDYILGGDTHERVRTPIQCTNAKVVEPGAFGSFVGKLDLTIANGKVVRDEYALIEVDPDRYKADPSMTALIEQNEAPFRYSLDTIIGYSTIPLYRYFVVENTIDTLILDALHDQVKEVDVALSNGFRFCPPRSTPDQTGNIPITESFLYDMLPVDSPVRIAQATGKQIREWLEKELNNVFAKDASERFGGWLVKFKGMEMKFNAFGAKGQRVKEITIGGQPLDPNRYYTLCACERDGDPEDMLCRIKGVVSFRNAAFSLHEVMKRYLQKNSPVTPTPHFNAKILDASPQLLTQVTGVPYSFR